MRIIDVRKSDGHLVVRGGSLTLPTSDITVSGAPLEGSLRWNAGGEIVEYYNGTMWLALSGDGVTYVGTWDALTNTPTLVSGVGTKGHYYKVSVTGTTLIDGIDDWYAGDSIIFNGTTWDKIAGTDYLEITLSGDVTGSGITSISTTLANTGVTAATYTKVTVDSKGRVTVGATAALDDLSDVEITSPAHNSILTYDTGDSKWKDIPAPYDVYGTYMGVPQESQVLWRIVFARTVHFPVGLSGSTAISVGGPLADASLHILKNGVEIGTIDFDAGLTIGSFTFASAQTFNSGDTLSVEGPSPMDVDLFTPSWAFVGYR